MKQFQIEWPELAKLGALVALAAVVTYLLQMAGVQDIGQKTPFLVVVLTMLSAVLTKVIEATVKGMAPGSGSGNGQEPDKNLDGDQSPPDDQTPLKPA